MTTQAAVAPAQADDASQVLQDVFPARVHRKFPNGKIWPVEQNIVFAIGTLDDFDPPTDDEIPSALAEFVTGSTCGLTGILESMRGNDRFELTAEIDVEAIGAEFGAENEAWTLANFPVISDRRELIEAFTSQYDLSDVVEAMHAVDSLDVAYADECVRHIHGGRDLCVPAYPSDCTYVRVVVNGLELAYWSAEEVGERPAEVLGAIIGALEPSIA